MFEWLSDPNAWIGLLTLTALELVLGIDNIVFLTLVVSRLPWEQQHKARRIGLLLAMLMRLGLLASISWVMSLTLPLFSALGRDVSGRDLILLLGGLFLIVKATHEIHHSVEGASGSAAPRATTFSSALFQIVLLDIIFSLDSVITAVGLVEHLPVMMIAVVVSVIVMLYAAKPIAEFVEKRPSFKILALAFLLLVGFTLMAEGLGLHVPKGYIYFAMCFSLGVELLNQKRTRNAEQAGRDR
jgi:predicted tellurium resistance membrane protein TerC